MTDPSAPLRQRFAGELTSKRAIRSSEWRMVFEQVPRHLFVPQFYRERGGRIVDSSVAGPVDEWLTAVYSDESLATQYGEGGWSTSSSSTPSIMAMMLEALDVGEGNRVLEIGTGTGYNAALLCERLGSEAVTTVDVDAELVAVARDHLAAAGYWPAVYVGDGYEGCLVAAPYDRVIGTCFVWPLPQAWIEQTTPSGRIVAVAPNGLVTLTVATDGSASGPFHPQDFGFMYMRGGHMPPRVPASEVSELVAAGGETRSCRRPAHIVHAGNRWSFWFWFGLFAPFVDVEWTSRTSCSVVDAIDRSWYRLNLGRNEVTQGGPRMLWDEVEASFDTWCALGAPNREELGLTVTSDGRHRLWLARPDSGQSWELKPAARVTAP